LVRNPWTNKSRGFVFVNMETRDVADRCIKYLDRTVHFDRVITVKRVIFSITGFRLNLTKNNIIFSILVVVSSI